MILKVQIQSVIYALLTGWISGLIYTMYQQFYSLFKNKFIHTIMDILFFGLWSVMTMWGLYKVNGGILRFYLILVFLTGYLIYYLFYFPLFFPFFFRMAMSLRNIFHPIYLAFCHLSDIINIRQIRLRRMRKWQKQRKNQSST